MSKPKHIKLLQYLEQQGVGFLTDISPFMIDNFKKPTTLNHEEYSEQVRAPILFLMDLNNRQLIKADDWEDGNNHSSFISQPSFRSHYEKPKWYSDFSTNVYLTSTGSDYLDNYRYTEANKKLNESYIDVNKASKDNYRNQIIIGIVTIIIVGVSAYISWLTYDKADSTAASVDSLRLEIRKWRTQKIQTLNQTTLSPDHFRKP